MNRLHRHLTDDIDFDELYSLQKQRQYLASLIKEQNVKLEKKITLFSDMSTKVEKQKASIAMTQLDVKDLLAKIMEYKERFKGYNINKLDEVEKEIKHYSEQKEFFRKQKDRLDALKEDDLINKKQEAKKEARDCDRDLKEKVIAISIHEKEKRELNKEIAELETIGEVFINLESSKKQLEDIKLKFNARNNKLNEVKNTISTHSGSVSEMKKTVDTLAKKYEEIELKSRAVKTLLQEKATIETGIEALSSEQNLLEKELVDRESELQSKVDTLNGLKQNREKIEASAMDIEMKLKNSEKELAESTATQERYSVILGNYEKGISQMRNSILDSFSAYNDFQKLRENIQELSETINGV